MPDEQVKDQAVADPDVNGDAHDDVEHLARAQGWKPKEEYDRDPDNWVDAQTFLKRAEDSAPIRNERLKKMGSELTATRRKIAEMEKAQRQFFDFHQKSLIAERERTIAELQAKQEEAVAAGDVEEYKKINAQIDAQVRAIQDLPRPQPQQASREVAEFIRKYGAVLNANSMIRGAAMTRANELNMQGVPEAQQVEIIERELAETFPKQFRVSETSDEDADDDGASRSSRRTSGVPALETGRSASRGSNRTNKGRGYDDLTPEAKAQCNDFVRRGWIKSKDDYVKQLPKNDPDVWAR